jgi:hypothetical protein
MVCLLAMAMILAVVAPPQVAMANGTTPQLSTETPSANAIDVSKSSNIVMQFDQNINSLTISENTSNMDSSISGKIAGSFTVSCDGLFCLYSSLYHPDCVYELRKGSLSNACHNFVHQVRDMHSDRREFLEMYRVCPLINLCMWCPAHAYLETGEMDAPVDYFCRVAHSRAEVLRYRSTLTGDCFHTKPWLKPKLVLQARSKPQEGIPQYCQDSDLSTKSG